MQRKIETAIPFDNHRSTPLAAIGPYADQLHNGGIDYLWLWDELSRWFHSSLWRPENTPMASVVDMDSTFDPFIEAAFALAHNPRMGIRVTTDGLRSGPAELLRRILTLQHAAEGKVVCAIGAGELRQTKPFGYKRSEGLARMEDTFHLIRALYDSTEPLNYEGKHWNYKNAFIGNTRPRQRPEFWALGGGPQLLDIAARYADGFEAAVPMGFRSPEEFGATVKTVREKVESYGRDPAKFGFGIWFHCVMHEDPDVITAVLDNPILKFWGGMLGRLDQTQWLEEGFTPLMPEGWHYATKWTPYEQTEAEVSSIIARVPHEMARKGFHCGTPAQLTKLCREYVDAGASFVGMLDLTPLVLGPLEGQQSVRRGIEMFTALKQGVA